MSTLNKLSFKSHNFSNDSYFLDALFITPKIQGFKTSFVNKSSNLIHLGYAQTQIQRYGYDTTRTNNTSSIEIVGYGYALDMTL